MQPRFANSLRWAGIACFTLLAGCLSANAQQASGDSATLQAILEELRQMKTILERASLIMPRIQLTAQRLQVQQDRTDKLSRELRDLRLQLAQHTSERDRSAGILKEVESELGQNPEPGRRKELDQLARRMAQELERLNLRDQEERSREIDLLVQVKAEEGKLLELSNQFSTLDRELDRR